MYPPPIVCVLVLAYKWEILPVLKELERLIIPWTFKKNENNDILNNLNCFVFPINKFEQY